GWWKGNRRGGAGVDARVVGSIARAVPVIVRRRRVVRIGVVRPVVVRRDGDAVVKPAMEVAVIEVVAFEAAVMAVDVADLEARARNACGESRCTVLLAVRHRGVADGGGGQDNGDSGESYHRE